MSCFYINKCYTHAEYCNCVFLPHRLVSTFDSGVVDRGDDDPTCKCY